MLQRMVMLWIAAETLHKVQIVCPSQNQQTFFLDTPDANSDEMPFDGMTRVDFHYKYRAIEVVGDVSKGKASVVLFPKTDVDSVDSWENLSETKFTANGKKFSWEETTSVEPLIR